MEKKEYIERNALMDKSGWYNLIDGRSIHGVQDYEIASVPSADVVPWSWLQSYADGKRCNFASDFVIEAKEAYERGES